jgi:hypothetical protein
MQTPSRKLWLLISALVVVFGLSSLEAWAQNAVLKEGSDCWQTEPGTEQRLHTIPAGFFGRGSQAVPNPTIKFKGVPLPTARVKGAFPPDCGCPDKVDVKITWTDPHGNVTKDMRHAIKQHVDESTKVDTCVHRMNSAAFKGKGASQKVEIQLVALSLTSVAPLKVTYKNPGAANTTKSFDVFVTESGTQDKGDITLTANSVNRRLAKGNVKLGNLHITYDVKFVEHGGTATYTMTGQKLHLVNTPGTFEQVIP